MWEANFGTINRTVARSFDDCEDIGIARIENYVIECFLRIASVDVSSIPVVVFTYINRVDGGHRD